MYNQGEEINDIVPTQEKSPTVFNSFNSYIKKVWYLIAKTGWILYHIKLTDAKRKGVEVNLSLFNILSQIKEQQAIKAKPISN